MAYNNNFPINYQQTYYPQYQALTQPNSNVNQSNSSIIWVQGEAGAKSYLVAPNTTVQLWDSEEQIIYLKSADASGMPSMKILDYKIRDNMPVKSSESVSETFATKEDINVLQEQIDDFKRVIDKMSEPDKKQKKAVTKDE